MNTDKWKKMSKNTHWAFWQSKENPTIYLSYYGSRYDSGAEEKLFYSNENNISLIYC